MLPGEDNLLNSLSSYNNRATQPGFLRGVGDWFSGASDPLGQAAGGLLTKDAILGSIDPVTGVKTNGWGGLALNSAQALGSGWMAMKQYGLAKDQLKFQKQAFNKNYAAQRQTLNTQLEDRQRARVASNPGAYESVESYLPKHMIR